MHTYNCLCSKQCKSKPQHFLHCTLHYTLVISFLTTIPTTYQCTPQTNQNEGDYSTRFVDDEEEYVTVEQVKYAFCVCELCMFVSFA